MCSPLTSCWLQRKNRLFSSSLDASCVFLALYVNITFYNTHRKTKYSLYIIHVCSLQSVVQSFSVLTLSATALLAWTRKNFKFILSLGPDQTLRGTVIRTSGPCLEPVLTVGEPQHPFPSTGSSSSQRTGGKHWTSTQRPISLQDQPSEACWKGEGDLIQRAGSVRVQLS